jgi:hypothetical protein
MKRVILAALAATMLAVPAGAAEKLKFAVVPKAMSNPFFDIARDGCMKSFTRQSARQQIARNSSTARVRPRSGDGRIVIARMVAAPRAGGPIQDKRVSKGSVSAGSDEF